MAGMFKLGCAALALAAATSAGAVTITNGGFEATSPSGEFEQTTTLSGWDVTGSIDLIGSYWTPAEGSNSIDLNGGEAGSISQTLSGLSVGTTYIVSFFISGNPDNDRSPNPKTAELSLGSTDKLVSYTLTDTNTRSTMNWTPVSYSFLATDTTAFLGLQSTVQGAYGLAVDGFSISAAPEPGTWGMMIMGFGLAGAAMRRRRTTVAAVA